MNIKKVIKKVAPPFLISIYHYKLALLGAFLAGFPSKKLIVIGVTGTSGKSTTVDFITRMLEEAGNKVASVSSIRFKVGAKEWKNELKMTMPGRLLIQKIMRQAVQEGCKYMVVEVTSEGIKQFRHTFIHFDSAVFLNLTPEHIESHGGFESYRNEKLKLFQVTKNLHIVNIDDKNSEYFLTFPAKKTITFGLSQGDVNLQNSNVHLNILGHFNRYNALAAIAVATNYGVSLEICRQALEKVTEIPGRMEVVSKNPLVIVDYAHTPEQLEQAYKSVNDKPLICVLGSCGGGRDQWKRPVLGKIAKQYCKEIIITNEDPYDEDPEKIIDQVAEGAGSEAIKIIDRREAIRKAVSLANDGETIIITGKGSEPLMCLARGQKIPWSDKEVVQEVLGIDN